MRNRTFWFDGRNLKNEEGTLSLVANLSFENLLIDFEMLNRIKPQKKMKIIVAVNCKEEIDGVAKDKVILSDKLDLLNYSKTKGFSTAYLTGVSSEEEMNSAWKNGVEHNYLVLEFTDSTNIPLELILARTQNTSTTIIKMVRTLEDAIIAFGVMEKGSDGVLISTESMGEIVNVDKYMKKEKIINMKLVSAKVTDVRHVGMGERACIDTSNLLKQNEGMIIGSTSSGGILVSSETHYLPYMDLRPFRVNAGAIHSYVWGADDMTPYISDLKAGAKLLCVDTEGNAREVIVGRVKIEVRPLLMICAEAEGVAINVIVQDDWHIRIFGSKGEVRNASEIKIGDELLGYICQSGRHVGIKIDENLTEK
jgi:3-dehydroquinate synthase II/3-amino-4-hydroxybenzoic acid synthase